MKKTGIFLVMMAVMGGGYFPSAWGKQPSGPMPSPPTPGGKIEQKVPPSGSGQPSTRQPSLGVQAPGTIPTLPVPGRLPPMPSSGLPGENLPGDLSRQAIGRPTSPGSLRGSLQRAEAFPEVGGLELPEPPMPTYPGTQIGQSRLPSVGGGSPLSSALFSDPIYGPYVPNAPPIGMSPTVGALPGPTPGVVGEKPFSDYRPPEVYSPYMNLYRYNPRGPIDNYYSLVRPFLMQNSLNQTYNLRLRILERNAYLRQQNQLQQGPYPIRSYLGDYWFGY